jgi:predicted alpha-1,6-mannanase (GH76 family)
MIRKLCFLILLMTLFFMACEKNDDPVDDEKNEYVAIWSVAADSSSSNLIYSYWNADDHYFNDTNAGSEYFQYWPQAHALDVMLDTHERTNNNLYKTIISDWYSGVKAKNGNTFHNVFYDDMEWITLAMLRAYNATQDEKYKTAAIGVWKDIQTGWNTTYANGGIAWKKDRLYSKNACSNGPACIIAARMYQQFGDVADKDWALKIYNWEKEYLFDQSNGAVYDNIDGRTGAVKINWIFTYNEGTFLGSALELYKITGEQVYLDDAIKAASYTINNLINVNDGILKKEGEDDGGLFKGVFVRYFTQLILEPDLNADIRKEYIDFLLFNAETLWNEGTNKQLVLFGPYWKIKPETISNLKIQISGATLIEAVSILEKENLLDNISE